MTSYPLLIRARALTGFAALVDKHGGNALDLLAEVDLPPSALEAPESTILLDKTIRLMEHAATTLGIPDFGLQLATYQDISILGPVAAIARHASTVGEAFDAIRRYMPYHTPGGILSTGPAPTAGQTRIRYELSLPPDQPRRHAIELSYAVANKFLRMVVPGPAAWTIRLRHPPALAREAYRDYFGCEVCFDQPSDALDLPNDLMGLPMDQSNPELARVAEVFVANVVKRHPLDLPRQVEILAGRQLAVGGCSLAGIARQLAVNERTLQRRLAEHGVIFEVIVDRLRQERAAEYLPHSIIPLAQVAGLLGYNDQSSFNRACKRWFGLTPLQVRSRILPT